MRGERRLKQINRRGRIRFNNQLWKPFFPGKAEAMEYPQSSDSRMEQGSILIEKPNTNSWNTNTARGGQRSGVVGFGLKSHHPSKTEVAIFEPTSDHLKERL